MSEFGVAWGGATNTKTPQSERSTLLVQTIPTANTEEFNIWLDGQFFNLAGITAMPANGTVMTVTTAYGTWNTDQTEFTQVPDPAFPGDRWKIDVSPMTMNAEDADLSQSHGRAEPLHGHLVPRSVSGQPPGRVRQPARPLHDPYLLAWRATWSTSSTISGQTATAGATITDWDRLDSNGNPRDFTGYDNHGGTEPWNLRNRFGVTVASGLYFFHVTDTRGETYTGKFYVIN